MTPMGAERARSAARRSLSLPSPLLVAAALAAAAGCGDSPPGRTFYQRNIEPILQQKCAGNTSGCHSTNPDDPYQFAAGAHMRGTIVPTKAEPEVAKKQKQYEGASFDFVVDRVEPEKLFAFRWHPYAVEPDFDYSKEPMTLVVFTLDEVTGGTQLTVTETGFDALPLSRRKKAFEMNEGGWTAQMALIGKYLAR